MKALPKNLALGDIIFIDWHDAYKQGATWSAYKGILRETACKCFSCGMYIGQNQSKDVMIATSWDTDQGEDRAFGGVFARPLLMIQRIIILKKGTEVKKLCNV